MWTSTSSFSNSASAEKGNRTYERYADHLAAALAEFEKLEVEVHTREWRAIV